MYSVLSVYIIMWLYNLISVTDSEYVSIVIDFVVIVGLNSSYITILRLGKCLSLQRISSFSFLVLNINVF